MTYLGTQSDNLRKSGVNIQFLKHRKRGTTYEIAGLVILTTSTPESRDYWSQTHSQTRRKSRRRWVLTIQHRTRCSEHCRNACKGDLRHHRERDGQHRCGDGHVRGREVRPQLQRGEQWRQWSLQSKWTSASLFDVERI